MASAAVPSNFIKACRWSLLGAGVVYGFFHRSTLEYKERGLHEIAEHKKQAAAAAAARSASQTTGVVMDPTAPGFDEAKWIAAIEAAEKK
eukprot:m.26508 g.26508  ORF g.26508 m.26508 type:complete len:90 (+) comp13332_c0_seq2:97-366(+)